VLYAAGLGSGASLGSDDSFGSCSLIRVELAPTKWHELRNETVKTKTNIRRAVPDAIKVLDFKRIEMNLAELAKDRHKYTEL